MELNVSDWKTVCRTTDGCSFPWGFNWIAPDKICELCLQHDFDYQFGGKYGISRIEADESLRDSIVEAGYPRLAKVMYRAVRIFGSHHYTLWRSFNYGNISEPS